MSISSTITQIIFWDCSVCFKIFALFYNHLSRNNYVRLIACLQLYINFMRTYIRI